MGIFPRKKPGLGQGQENHDDVQSRFNKRAANKRAVRLLNNSANCSLETFNMIRRVLLVLLLGVLLGNIVPAAPAESSTAAGVVSVAPQISELGAGWGERNVIFAIDPLEQPAEFVNAYASRNPTNRVSIVQFVRKSMSINGSVGMTEIWYGPYEARLELIISRYPDQQSLDKHWKEFNTRFNAKAGAPKVGQAAGWLDVGAEVPGREFVFRQGLFSAVVSCKVALSGEPLMKLAKATADRMAKAAEPGVVPTAPVPHR